MEKYNLKDFPAENLAEHDIRAQHPDDFLVALLDASPALVCGAVKRQREGLRIAPKTADELLTVLESQGLTQGVARLRAFAELL